MNWSIDSEQLKKEIGHVVLVDVREPEEYAEAHIEGGKLIPLGELGVRAAQELKPDQDIVVYCAHGVRSMHGLMALKQMGFQKLRSLEGGIVAWMEAGGPTRQ